jgi:hypothetical protein
MAAHSCLQEWELVGKRRRGCAPAHGPNAIEAVNDEEGPQGGMVPREYTTGGKQKLRGSVNGEQLSARLFAQGARAVIQRRHNHAPRLRAWLAQLLARSHPNVVIVALANKLLRMA